MKIGKIEKDIKIKGYGFAISKYNFHLLDINDSIYFEFEKYELPAMYNRIKLAADIYGKRHKKKLTMRADKKGVRIWRTE